MNTFNATIDNGEIDYFICLFQAFLNSSAKAKAKAQCPKQSVAKKGFLHDIRARGVLASVINLRFKVFLKNKNVRLAGGPGVAPLVAKQ